LNVVSAVTLKLLALLDYALGYFALCNIAYNNTDPCKPMDMATAVNVALTPCGESLLRQSLQLWELINCVFRPLECAILVVKSFSALN
jgi:hypothetical protein